MNRCYKDGITSELTCPRSRCHRRGSGEATCWLFRRRRPSSRAVDGRRAGATAVRVFRSFVAAAASGGSLVRRAHSSPRPLDLTPYHRSPHPVFVVRGSRILPSIPANVCAEPRGSATHYSGRKAASAPAQVRRPYCFLGSVSDAQPDLRIHGRNRPK